VNLDNHPNNRIAVRQAGPDDAARIIAGIETVCAEGVYFVTERFLSDAQWEAALYQPDTVPDHLLTIAEVDGQFAGSGNLFPGPEGRKDRHVANLGIYVLKPFRGQGAGTALMRWMINWAMTIGLRKVTLSVLATNHLAIHLYRKFGFDVEGVLRQQYRIGNDYVDSVLMARFLPDRVIETSNVNSTRQIER
jgi:RimJ/RimL family protein N-acetyltransferase